VREKGSVVNDYIDDTGITSVLDTDNHIEAALAPGKNFDEAPAPSLLYTNPTFF
jgi:hypothetical protein